MKLSLSSDYGTPEHWGRILDFGKRYNVDRMVYWGDSCTGRNKFSGFTPPFLYPKYPELNKRIQKPFKEAIYTMRDYFQQAYEMTAKNKIEFWYVFQVLQFPDIGFQAKSHLKNVDLSPVREIYPDLVNKDSEIDMSSPFIYEFIKNQIDELFELAPALNGIELWIMERSTIKIARLKKQCISTDEIIQRVVDTVHGHLTLNNCKLDVDLHTAGGETKTLNSLMTAAQKHNDIFISADNTIGDYHLHLPFNKHLQNASKSNKVIVNFDLNGEYWGRNYIPTTAINHYEDHIREAAKIDAEYINGRVATENDMRNPHANVLPSRVTHYPFLTNSANTNDITLPVDLRIPVIDTLGVFNAIYFCLKCKNEKTEKEIVIKKFLQKEFGFTPKSSNLDKFTNIFLNLEETLKKIFYIDENLYHGQSLLCQPLFIPIYAIDAHLTSAEGTLFPTGDAIRETNDSVHPVAFEGWPVQEGHICCGPEIIIREKEDAVFETAEILKEIVEITSEIKPESGSFLTELFEDLHSFAGAFNILTQVHIHYFLIKQNKSIGKYPDTEKLKQGLSEMLNNANDWLMKYPEDRYSMSETLKKWHDIISNETLV